MPAFAPRTAILAERTRGQDARDAHYVGSVKIGSINHLCELFVAGHKVEQHADGSGFAHVQRITAKIRKTRLATSPPRDTVLTIDGTQFTVESVDGQSSHEPAWVIHALRLPPAP